MTETPGKTETPENRRSRDAQSADGTKYRVVAAKKGLPFRDVAGDFGADDLNPLSWVISWVVSGLMTMFINASMNRHANGATSWKVGVIRVGRLREKFVHKELLAPGLDPGQRIGELVDSIKLGLLV